MRMKMAITSSSYDPATEQEMWPLGTMLVKMAARRPVDIFVFHFAREPGMHVRSRIYSTRGCCAHVGHPLKAGTSMTQTLRISTVTWIAIRKL